MSEGRERCKHAVAVSRSRVCGAVVRKVGKHAASHVCKKQCACVCKAVLGRMSSTQAQVVVCAESGCKRACPVKKGRRRERERGVAWGGTPVTPPLSSCPHTRPHFFNLLKFAHTTCGTQPSRSVTAEMLLVCCL